MLCLGAPGLGSPCCGSSGVRGLTSTHWKCQSYNNEISLQASYADVGDKSSQQGIDYHGEEILVTLAQYARKYITLCTWQRSPGCCIHLQWRKYVDQCTQLDRLMHRQIKTELLRLMPVQQGQPIIYYSYTCKYLIRRRSMSCI